MALAVTVLAPVAAPKVLDAVRPAPQSQRVAVAPAPGKSFAPTCRGDEVLDSRPDPSWVSRSFDKDNCQEPAFPKAPNGATASRQQVVATITQAKTYAAAAGAFQSCVAGFVAAKRAQAAQGATPLTPSQLIIENHRILLSQRSAERAQAQARAVTVAFNAYGSGCDDP